MVTQLEPPPPPAPPVPVFALLELLVVVLFDRERVLTRLPLLRRRRASAGSETLSSRWAPMPTSPPSRLVLRGAVMRHVSCGSMRSLTRVTSKYKYNAADW